MTIARTFSFYDPKTGEFTGETISGSSPNLFALNIHEARPAIEGRYSRETHQVDLSGVTPRVVLRDKPRELSALEQHHNALAQIRTLEESQHRALREYTLNQSAEALDRLHLIDNQIAALRKQL
jgi:hypothetical protein